MSAQTPPPANPNEATANELFIFDQVKDRYNGERETTQNLTAKASNLVGWVGLIISIVLAGGGVLFSDIINQDQNNSATNSQNKGVFLTPLDVAFIIGLLLALLASLVVALFAIRVQEQVAVPDSRTLIETHAQDTHRATVRNLAVEYTIATENNIKSNKTRAKQVSASWILFIIGMGFTASFIILQFIKIIGYA